MLGPTPLGDDVRGIDTYFQFCLKVFIVGEKYEFIFTPCFLHLIRAPTGYRQAPELAVNRAVVNLI